MRMHCLYAFPGQPGCPSGGLLWALGIAVGVVVFLTGCSAQRQCPACEATDTPTVSQHVCKLSERDLQDALQGAFLHARSTTDFLLLSGGGSHGAWGAGVLYGWKGGIPSFQVVTGISTGALMATFAFLGEPYKEQLKHFYTDVSDRDVIRRRSVLTLPFSNSLYSLAPLRRLLTQNLTTAVIDDVAKASIENGRQLWVGTVDLDTGQFCAWDLTILARQKQYDLYRDVIFASASMPVFTPPVKIDNALHVDGGVRLQVFARTVLEQTIRAYRQGLRLKRERSQVPQSEEVPLTAYTIINGKLVVEKECVRNDLVHIGLRSLTLVLNETLLGNLHRMQEQYGDTWKFLASWIPHEYCLDFDSFDFDETKMERLFEAGVKWVQTQEWSSEITPTLDISPLPCNCGAVARSPTVSR